MSILLYINQALLKRGGGRGRPDFTIVFGGGGGGGGAGQEKSHLSHTKNQFSIAKRKKKQTSAEKGKARSEKVGGHTAEDKRQI